VKKKDGRPARWGDKIGKLVQGLVGRNLTKKRAEGTEPQKKSDAMTGGMGEGNESSMGQELGG